MTHKAITDPSRLLPEIAIGRVRHDYVNWMAKQIDYDLFEALSRSNGLIPYHGTIILDQTRTAVR
ncbi:unnamed protein product [marine sediment metagenome]|uniref:Uncharacterized protein n=1 Tax=marine sediment metagenome TaxID=412755 RepID=X0YYR2_9ZZZZ